MGNTWERTKITTKEVMYEMFKNAVLMDYQLQTVFTETQKSITLSATVH